MTISKRLMMANNFTEILFSCLEDDKPVKKNTIKEFEIVGNSIFDAYMRVNITTFLSNIRFSEIYRNMVKNEKSEMLIYKNISEFLENITYSEKYKNSIIEQKENLEGNGLKQFLLFSFLKEISIMNKIKVKRSGKNGKKTG